MIPTKSHRIRILIVAFPLLAGLIALGYRLYDLQVVRHAELAEAVNRIHERRIKLHALRGMIVDCNENILAHSVVVRTVIMDPELMRDQDKRRAKKGLPPQSPVTVQLLSQHLGVPAGDIESHLNDAGHCVVIRKKVPEEIVQHLREALKVQQIKGVFFDDDQMRFYPNGPLMSHVLGYVNSEQVGVDGVEFQLQKDLQGQDGWRRITCDRRGREVLVYRDEDFPARNGYNVVLTLDQAVQNIVEQELDVAFKKHCPESAVVIVMRPATGEILAMSNRPTFDPNSTKKTIDSLKNRAVADMIEPGSTFKIVTVAAALDQRLVGLNDSIWCENGRFLYAGRYLSDHEPYGTLSVADVLVKSSNIGAAKIALLLQNDKMFQAIRNFGFGEYSFGEKSGERWPGEIRGVVHPVRNWSKVSITRLAMGHEVGVTPVQMTAAMCAIANGGNLMRPQIIKRVVDQNGNVIREFFPQVRRRVVDEKAARETIEALRQVVSKAGTAAKAIIPGFDVAGKTGTAQKIVNGQYVHDSYVSSFAGFFPAGNPEICIYVMINDPKGKEYYGGTVAAPVFHDIAVRVGSYLNIKPTMPIGPGQGGTGIVQAANHGGGR